MGYRIPNDVRQGVANSYRSGMSIADIIKKYGVSNGSIYNIVKKRRGRKPDKITGRNQDVIATMNYQGYSDVAIAKRLGVDQKTVHRHRTRMGLPVVPLAKQRKRVKHNG